MEVFYEKNVTNPGIDKHAKRAIVFKVIRIVCLVLAVFLLIFLPMFLPVSSEASCGTIALSLLFALLFTVTPLVLTYVFIGRLDARLSIEYDYYILGTTFRIVKVIKRKKRKRYLEFPISAISSLGLVESEQFNRHAADKSNKKQFAFCNDNNPLLLFAIVNALGGRQLLVLEGDDEFITQLRKAIGSYSVLDDSLKQYALNESKRAALKEREEREATASSDNKK